MRSLRHARRLQEATEAFIDLETIEDVARTAADVGVRALEAAAVSVMLVDGDGKTVRSVAEGRTGDSAPAVQAFPLTARNVVVEAIDTRSLAVVEGLEDYTRRFGAPSPERTWQGGSRACAPLLVQGEAIGALAVGFPDWRAIDDDTRALIVAMARQAAMAIERARLRALARGRQEHATLLAEATRRSGEAWLDMDGILQVVVEQLARGVGHLCGVRLLEPDGAGLRLRASCFTDAAARVWADAMRIADVVPIDNASYGSVLRTGRTLHVPRVEGEQLLGPAAGDAVVRRHGAAGLVQQLLDVSRIQGGQLTLEREEHDVARLLRDLVARFEDTAAKIGIALRVDAPASLSASVPA